MFIFREACETDFEPIARLHALSWQRAYRGILTDSFLDGPVFAERTAAWKERLSGAGARPLFALLALEENALAGFVCVMPHVEPQWGAFLDNLHVHPGAQRKGLGRILIGRAAGAVNIRQSGSSMYLWVYEANMQARAFYERMGGVAAERAARTASDGTNAPVLRYVWHDLPQLIRSATK